LRAQLRAEFLKQRSTRTAAGLFAAMLGLVVIAVFLHGFGLPADELDDKSAQLMVFGRGEALAALFAALLGAMSITAEIRHGTIRPTFLITPRRGRVVAAKVFVTTLIGAGFGLVAGALAAGLATVAFRTRGIDIQLGGDDYTLLVAGAAAAGALWAAIGVGVGAFVRNQVPTLIGICAWLLFVEGLLIGDVASVSDVARFLPGAAASAISGQDPSTLLTPGVALLVLSFYAAAAAVLGSLSTARRDVP
jgi:ABC-2 type transport system permease protein